MPNLYVTSEQLRLAAVANEADVTDVWESLAEGVSRLFDRECEVPDGFFSVADADVSVRSYAADGTKYLQVLPYIPDSITILDVDGTDRFEATPADREYREKDGYILFNTDVSDGLFVDITARHGFAAVPADIQIACIEQALAMWRRKDLSFAEISGVSAAAINAEFSPTFAATARRYREIYSRHTFFS